ncbi:MAG: histidine kinase N-terminal 7TM domain-containing protein [Desulfovibrio sp.]
MVKYIGILFLCFSCSGILSLIYYSVRVLKTNGGRPFIFLMLSVFIYSLGYMLELSGTSGEEIFFALRVEYLGIPFVAVFWFLFAFEYNKYKIKNKLLYASLFAIPFVTTILLYTNDFHHYYYKEFGVDTSGPFPVASFVKGIWYYVEFAYHQLLSLVGVVLFYAMTRKARGYRKKQANVIFLASLIPWAGNLAEQVGLTLQGIDMVPFYLALPMPLFAIAMSRLRMFNIAPIARDKVFETMRTPVIVLDKNFHIADFNAFACNVLPELSREAIGLSAHEVLAARNGFMDKIMMVDQGPMEVEFKNDGDTRHFSISVTNLVSTQGNDLGLAILLYDITENKRLLDQLRQMASVDALTGVSSRGFFLKSCLMEITRVSRYGGSLPFMLIDIDHFKQVNDTFGHLAGDLVLRNVTSTFRRILRASDMIGRYGGEEFTVMLPETDLEGAKSMAERMRKAVQDTVSVYEGHEITVTISMGIACFSSPRGAVNTDGDKVLADLLKDSDKALYKAKSLGRNQVQWTTWEDHAHS